MLLANAVQENDVERATALDRQQEDYVKEEAWKWALSGCVVFEAVV